MADTTLNQPFDISNFHPEKYSTPNTGMPGLDQLANNAELLGPSAQEYNQSTPTGESISDIINQVRDIQSGMSTLVNPYGGPVPNSPSPGGFDVNQSLKDLSKSIQTESLEAYGKPVIIGKEADFKRYKDSPYFQTFGYTPNLGSEQEYKYGNAQTWGDTIGNAIAGGVHLAADTFVEGWKGWGRMAEALFTWDSSKLMGTPEEREEMARKQNDLMSKYAIYDTAESKDSLWNRQFFGNMLQQSGFAVGAIGQFALEEFLTAGAASFLEPALKGVMIGRVAKTAEEAAAIRKAAGLAEKTTILGRAAESTKNFFRPNIELATTADDLVNSTRQVANTITKSPNIVNSIASGLKTLTPGYGTVEEMIKLNKAGAGFAQLAYTGLGGIKRGLSEFNMARSESIFEAASTYTQLKDRLTEDFIQKNGREPSDDELEKIKQSAENASHDNFAVNMGVLSVMNRIQFDNMFKQFSKSRTLLSEGAAALEGKAFQVTGKIAGKTESRVFKEGLFGRIGALPEIAKTFGKKEAAWQATKAIGKGLMKFEGSEGMQELIQTASDKGLEDYYYQLYHGKKGYTGELDAVVSNLQNPLTDMEGMKTFLMGALTGRLISPISFAFSKTQQKVTEYKNAKKSIENYQKVLENKRAEYVEKYGKEPEGEDALEIEKYAKTTTEYKTLSDQVDESVNLLNALYTNPQWLRNEALANIKVNNQAAATMEEAAANSDRYVFNNVKDSALAKTVAAAIKLDLYSSLRDVIKEYGVEFSDEDFKQAFGIEPTEKNRQNAKQLAENVVAQIEDYYDTFKILKDKYADRIIPDLYKYNKPKDYIQAMTQKKVLDDIIEMLATNSFKSKRAIIRASQLQTEIAQNKNIGSSAMEVLTKLGSDQALIKHTLTLAEQLDNMSAQETPLTPAQRELYKSIDEELTHIKDWYDSREELLNEREVEKSYKAYAALINIFNKRAGLTTAVSREDVEETFLKFKDYIKLNNDNKQYVDAMNLLADPKNMKLVEEAYSSAREFFRSRSMEEQKREIEDATGVPIARHTFKKEVDDTYTVTSPDGVVVEKGITTMEEAKIKANELDAKLREELAKEEAETKAKEEEAVVTEEEEVKTTEETTVKSIIEDIKKANQAELNKLKETDTSKFTDAEKDEIEKAIATREDELQDIAIKTGTIKTILDTDPEFIVPYMEALEKIDAVVNNPDVTINEVRNIFKILTPVFAKLDKETRNKYSKQYADKRKSIEERINEEIQSKDIEGVKALITKTLALESTPIDVSFQTMYNQLNLKLKPEFKEEAIEHFEKEYIKAIDKKLAKLRSELNNSKSSEAITKLLAISLNFRNRIQKSIEEFEKKSKELNDAKGTLSFTIAVDDAWSNPVHRGILNTSDKESSSAQKIAISNFMISGMISQEDLENVDITRRHDASEIINLGVARMLTLQINKAADDHFNNKGSEKLKEVLTEYLISSGEYGNKLEVEEYMEDFLNKDEYPDKDSLLKALFIPNSKIVDDKQYKLLTLYRITTSTLMQNLSKLDAFDQFAKHQENLIRDQEGTITDEDIITKDLVKYLERYLTKGKTIDELYTDILEAFDKLKTIDTYDEASKLIISSVSSKNLQARGDGLSILQGLLGISLETYNILKSDSVNFTPLSEEEIVRVLNGEMLGSINKEQLSQIEEYAKVDKLEEYKKRFQAATGYINNEPIFTYDKITPVTSNPGFNSLRTKSENDVRTAQDLSVSLMPDENGLVQTKFALTFIVNSPYSTQAEKMLAKRLLNLVSDKETIKIDNTIEASGEFDPETDEIFINLEATGYKSDRPSAPVETVILHELVHGLTEKAIADPNSNYRKEIKALYDLVKTKEGAKTFYAYSDTIDSEAQLREFVTEAFTNPAFQYLLATTKYGDENRTVWDKFLDFVNSILEAIGVDINNTALSRVISLTDELLNKNAIIDADKLPSEEMMEKIKNAKSEKDINEISKNLEENKDKYTSGMYNALNAALKNKLKSINARQVQDILKGMKSIKIDKTTYYYTNDNGVITVYKKGRSKVTKVKDSAIIDDISKQLGVTPPPLPPSPEPVPEGKTVQIFSNLADKKFVEDPSTLTYPAGDSNIVAQDPDSLRSKSSDGITQNGEFIEYRNFTRYYSKVRSIINKLSVAPLEELENFYVVLDKDSAGLRWDGSSEYPGTPGDPRDLSWKDSEKGIVGYIADENGNPIVFDKEGKAIGIADRNDPASSELNNGENQIVYFVTTSENTKEDQLAQMDKESLDKLFAARKAAKEGRPQIAKLQKVTVGQMNLGYMTKAQGRSQRNTARDKELTEKMNQDHVSFQLEGNHLNILIEDASGAVNKTALFTPSSRFVKVVGAEGQTYTLFDHAIELMKIYQQMVLDKDPNLTNVKSNLVDFLQNIWLTGSKFNLTIPLTLASMSVKASKEDPWMVKKLFNIKDGIITVNEENLKALKNHIEDMKINISKEWIEGKKDFNFPYITEKDGKKIVTFEKRDYKDFLVNNVGLITYISNIPAKEDIKRYNSNVHFLEPSDLIPKNPTIKVTEKQLVNDKNTTEKAVDDAAKTATPTTETKEEIINPAKKKRLSAPSYEQTYEETYQKICK